MPSIWVKSSPSSSDRVVVSVATNRVDDGVVEAPEIDEVADRVVDVVVTVCEVRAVVPVVVPTFVPVAAFAIAVDFSRFSNANGRAPSGSNNHQPHVLGAAVLAVARAESPLSP